MKRKFIGILTGALMACLFAGCGETLPQKKTTDTTTENAVGQREEEAYRLSDLAQGTGALMCVTENSIFVAASEDSCVYPNCIRQYDRQGNKQNSYSLGYSLDKGCVEGISEQFVCYTERSWEDKEILYLVPIETKQKEETIVLSKKKRIAELGVTYDIYVWKSHVYYISEGDGIYHYNAETGDLQCFVKLDEEDDGEFILRKEASPYVDGDQRIYLSINDDTCYRIDREKAKIERVPALDEKLSFESWDIFPMKDNLVFITKGKLGQSPDRYIWYDIGTDKEQSSFQKKDLQKFLEQQGFEKKKLELYIERQEVTQVGDRLYLSMNLTWEENVTAETGPQKGKKVAIDKKEIILLSCPCANLKDLRYEKEISEWIRDHQEYEQTYFDLPEECDGRKYYAYMGRVHIWTFCGNELLISYEDQWEKEKTGVRRVDHYQLKGFDLTTGQMRDISEKDTIYQIFDLAQKLDLEAGMGE